MVGSLSGLGAYRVGQRLQRGHGFIEVISRQAGPQLLHAFSRGRGANKGLQFVCYLGCPEAVAFNQGLESPQRGLRPTVMSLEFFTSATARRMISPTSGRLLLRSSSRVWTLGRIEWRLIA